MGRIATVSDRTLVDAGNKAANTRDKVSVFVEFTFHFREDRENYKNNKQEKNPRDFKCLEETKKVTSEKMRRGGVLCRCDI